MIPREALQHMQRCGMLSIMLSINSEGSASHCSSKAVESMARVLVGGLRAAILRTRTSETCCLGDRVDRCFAELLPAQDKHSGSVFCLNPQFYNASHNSRSEKLCYHGHQIKMKRNRWCYLKAK
ncbi:hypothetical protein TNCV_2081181 [Trichonephila clavipes]|nr:hypothetical protein TNCV_2081181 [Trichonephila clavipes]